MARIKVKLGSAKPQTKEVVRVESSLSSDQASRLHELISELVAAEVADSWKGGGDPVDVPVVEAELALAKANLVNFIAKLVRNGE